MSTRLDAKYLTELTRAIETTTAQFRHTPASFLHESDLQGLLFARLFSRLAKRCLPIPAQDQRWNSVPSQDGLLTNPVQSFYPVQRRFDLALIASALTDEDAWSQPVRAAIQIRLWQIIPVIRDWKPDRDKLARYHSKALEERRQFTGVCLVFSHIDRSPKFWGPVDDINPQRLSIPRDGVFVCGITP
jgi:hypothetical protein